MCTRRRIKILSFSLSLILCGNIENQKMNQWTAELQRWPMVTVFMVGQTSNVLSVLVLARPKLRKNTCSLYLLGASVSNTVCLFFGLFVYVLNSGFNVLVTSQSNFLCKFLPYIYFSSLFLASWFILLACIDRFSFSMSITWLSMHL